MKTLVLGLGNEMLTDDGIGIKLAKNLEEIHASKDVVYQSSAIGGMELIELIRDYDKLIVIDATKTGERQPGEVFHMTLPDFEETLHLSSFHDMSFQTMLKFSKQLGIEVPEQIDIIGIEIKEDLTFSNDYSHQIAGKYHQVFEKVSELFHKIIKE